MTDAHDRLAKERDAVRNAAARIVAGEDDFMGTEWGTALDALIEKAYALGGKDAVDRAMKHGGRAFWVAKPATGKEVTE